jgi:hypothetical protein
VWFSTAETYEATFKLVGKDLSRHGLKADSRVLTTETMQHFATWLRETPITPRQPKTRKFYGS